MIQIKYNILNYGIRKTDQLRERTSLSIANVEEGLGKERVGARYEVPMTCHEGHEKTTINVQKLNRKFTAGVSRPEQPGRECTEHRRELRGSKDLTA